MSRTLFRLLSTAMVIGIVVTGTTSVSIAQAAGAGVPRQEPDPPDSTEVSSLFRGPAYPEALDIAGVWYLEGVGLIGGVSATVELEISPKPNASVVEGQVAPVMGLGGEGLFVVPLEGGGFASWEGGRYEYTPYLDRLVQIHTFRDGDKTYDLEFSGRVRLQGAASLGRDLTMTGFWTLRESRTKAQTAIDGVAPALSSGTFEGRTPVLNINDSPTGKDLVKNATTVAGGESEGSGEGDLLFTDDFDIGEVEAYPVEDAAGVDSLLDYLESPTYLESDYQFEEYGEESLEPGIFDKGVNFSSMDFSGFALDSGSNAPFFRADLRPAGEGAPAVDRAELSAQTERFKRYFLEAITANQADIRVSIEALPSDGQSRQAQIVVPEAWRATTAAQVMVDADILMKQSFLADVVRGQEDVVNDGVTGLWVAELAESPQYGSWLARGLPNIGVSTRATIVSGPAQIQQGGDPAGSDDVVRVADTPLDLQTFLDRCELGPGFEDAVTDLQPIVDTVCGQITQRMTDRRPAFVTTLNTAPEYAELRLVHEAVVHAALYEQVVGDRTSPYGGFANTGVLPADLVSPTAFPEAEYLSRITATVGSDRTTAPCATEPAPCVAGESNVEIFGGVALTDPLPAAAPVGNAAEWSRMAVPSIGVQVAGDGTRALNLGTALAGPLPEYLARATGDPRASVTVTMRNVGTVQPASRYLLARDIAADAEGTILSETDVTADLSANAAAPGAVETVVVTCPSCGQVVPGAVYRELRVEVYLGKAEGNTFTLDPEFDPDNTTGIVFQGGDVTGPPSATEQ